MAGVELENVLRQERGKDMSSKGAYDWHVHMTSLINTSMGGTEIHTRGCLGIHKTPKWNDMQWIFPLEFIIFLDWLNILSTNELSCGMLVFEPIKYLKIFSTSQHSAFFLFFSRCLQFDFLQDDNSVGVEKFVSLLMILITFKAKRLGRNYRFRTSIRHDES